MKIVLSLIAAFICTLTLNAQVIPYQELPRPQAKPGLDLVLEYSSPRDEVMIKNGKLTHVSKTYHYDEQRPYVASPVGMSSNTISDGTPLSGQQLTALSNIINNCGILSLPQSDYGASIEERSYDYSFYIVNNGQRRNITYHSNPSYPHAPQSFERLKEYVWKLVAEVELKN
jgi:hypothetical protein